MQMPKEKLHAGFMQVALTVVCVHRMHAYFSYNTKDSIDFLFTRFRIDATDKRSILAKPFPRTCENASSFLVYPVPI